MSRFQHDSAERLLPIIFEASVAGRPLNYQMLAKELGRNPNGSMRPIGAICDLLDAAAALAGVPLLALVTVKNASGKINPNAWKKGVTDPTLRTRIIERSESHTFTAEDVSQIRDSLRQLTGLGNRQAWEFIRRSLSEPELFRRLTEPDDIAQPDAIDDIGTDAPKKNEIRGFQYARDPKIRAAVKARSGGKCEHCGELGFKCSNGERYIECHHIIALADEGEDRMSNVIALCARHHREAHFGEAREQLEKELIEKVRSLGL